jgi:YHS domain-containing protein
MLTRRTVFKVVTGAAVIGGIGGSIEVLAEVRSVAQIASPPERLGLKGYDPVAYFTLSAPTPGVAQYEYVYDGVRYHFANARHRDLFKANPEKYAPQFGGSCANNMANGVRRESDPTLWTIINGNLYVFAGAAGADRFRKEAQSLAPQANSNWKTLKDASSQ